MVRKTDSPAKRARQLLYRVDKEPAPKFLGPPPESRWNIEARAALSLEKMVSFISPDGIRHSVPPDFLDLQYETLRRAFDYFKLDPASPLAWRLLLAHLADIYFGPRVKKKPGAPMKWTAQVFEKLDSELVTKKLDNVPATRAGKRLANDKSSKFYSSGVELNAGKEALRKKIGLIRRKTAAKKIGTK
jgi:hypothetical protein